MRRGREGKGQERMKRSAQRKVSLQQPSFEAIGRSGSAISAVSAGTGARTWCHSLGMDGARPGRLGSSVPETVGRAAANQERPGATSSRLLHLRARTADETCELVQRADESNGPQQGAIVSRSRRATASPPADPIRPGTAARAR